MCPLPSFNNGISESQDHLVFQWNFLIGDKNQPSACVFLMVLLGGQAAYQGKLNAREGSEQTAHIFYSFFFPFPSYCTNLFHTKAPTLSSSDFSLLPMCICVPLLLEYLSVSHAVVDCAGRIELDKGVCAGKYVSV